MNRFPVSPAPAWLRLSRRYIRRIGIGDGGLARHQVWLSSSSPPFAGGHPDLARDGGVHVQALSSQHAARLDPAFVPGRRCDMDTP